MKVLNMGSERTTYLVEMSFSPLFEAALGIAVATYDQIHPTLEQPVTYWRQLLEELEPAVSREAEYAKRHNTWKTILHLLHLRPFADLESFLSFVSQLSREELRYQALPYLGEALQTTRRRASVGSEADISQMKDATRTHLFFPAYISHVATVDPEELRRHVLTLMEGWYLSHVKPRESEITRMLERDWAQKQAMQDKLSAEDLVEWAIDGSYPPEPTVTRVLLVPQAIYRPWTVQANAESTKIFYYPVADENLHDQVDPYRPPHSLVHALKALGDEHRLRLAKMLAERDMSLQDLAEKLGLAKSTAHHHLSMLRSAHLVESSGTKYRLRREALTKLPLLWDQFLGGSPWERP